MEDVSGVLRLFFNVLKVENRKQSILEFILHFPIGVEKVVSGYAGGNHEQPTYQEVCTGKTNHAEVIQITFDAQTIAYKQLLNVFFHIHDPTTKDR